ncbi:MAG: DUF4136 domain-containing protein [Deltaproteobacteria bacterium]|nr:DUF4136 domain-containing protein [Deltaproteobacteria bacterium]MBW2419224.1 DUF4136 domain-containing protein [Deltaproteobacteria bacterium]
MLDRRHALGLLALLLLLFAGCKSDDGLEVSSTYDPLTRFPAQASYAWDDAGSKLPTDPRIQALDLDPLIRGAANEEFALRGYSEVAAGAPNFLLSYELTVRSWIGPDKAISTASFSLLLSEATTGRHVWLGFARAPVQIGLDSAERGESIRKAVAKMLEQFPPSQREN